MAGEVQIKDLCHFFGNIYAIFSCTIFNKKSRLNLKFSREENSNMVEAVGVEPTSEAHARAASTRLSRNTLQQSREFKPPFDGLLLLASPKI